ncbi:lysozyme-like domain-containing protein [Obelidium mucronatum]|nr:lysozyme-like domain-containing protein [Obelidium mucronatum]
MKTSVVLSAIIASASVQAGPIERRQAACVNGAYGCSGQILQQCTYVTSTDLGFVDITTCQSGTVCSSSGTIGCVQGTAPQTTTTTTTTTSAPKPSPTTTTTATTSAATKSTTTTTTTTTTAAKTTTTATTTTVPVVKSTTTTATTTTAASTGGSGLPACFAPWGSNQAYPGSSQVSLNKINYSNKWYQNAGANPATNADGGWVAQGACDPTQEIPENPNGKPPTGHHFGPSQKVCRLFVSGSSSSSTQESADPAYTYTNFLKSVGFFPGFCDTYAGKDSDVICKKLLATMFAHFAQETGAHSRLLPIPEWQQSLVYVRELTCTETNTNPGCAYNNDCTNPAFNKIFPCAPGSLNGFKAYFGRGSHQLSYSFNYGPFSQVIYGTPLTLLNNPELVADTWLNLASSIFFFIYPQSPKPSMLGVMDGSWTANAADIAAGRVNDFPSTIQIINGECAGSSTSAAAGNRISYYKSFMNDMGLSTADANLKCSGMPAFDTSSSAAQTGYYWAGSYLNQGECQLVTYQTNFNALMDGPNYDQYINTNKAYKSSPRNLVLPDGETDLPPLRPSDDRTDNRELDRLNPPTSSTTFKFKLDALSASAAPGTETIAGVNVAGVNNAAFKDVGTPSS